MSGDVPRDLTDEQIVEALRVYQADIEAGRNPERGRLLERFPSVADELAGCIEALEFVHGATPGLRDPPGPARGAGLPPTTPEQLGDFRIVREIARGGMGVVYEARQISLDRRVALKVLPFAGMLDPRQLQRFRNEAQAAAQLHHSHIVPVYSVGSERGVHYYAMQFIDGMSLAELIAELRALRKVSARGQVSSSPSRPLCSLTGDRTAESLGWCRAIAGLGIQAAEALEHAHERGVVHRDVKPANLLVDAEGALWVTDFGLACFRAGPSLTMTGDVIGTVRYMSPEQALGGHAASDPRMDVYSLGVTLHEALTLEHAFPGEDAHTVLRAIQRDDPPRLRALNRAVPAELETILLKAMAKRPEARYATAEDFAADLRRFLEDRPIRARPPTVIQRANKWARRHRAVVGASVVILVMSVVGLLVTTLRVMDEERRTQAALRHEAATRGRLERNLTMTLEAIDAVYMQEGERRMWSQEGVAELDREFLQKGLKIYEQFAEANRDVPGLRATLARVYQSVARLRSLLGESASSASAYRLALAHWEELTRDAPLSSAAQVDRAGCLQGLATVLEDVGELAEAQQLHREAIAAYEAIRGPTPAARVARTRLPRALRGLALHMYRRGRFAESRRLGERAKGVLDELRVEKPDDQALRVALTVTLNDLALCYEASGDPEKELAALRSSVRLSRELPVDGPERLEQGVALGWASRSLARRLLFMQRLDEAGEPLRVAIDVLTPLVKELHNAVSLRETLGSCHDALGSVLRAQGLAKEAEAAYAQALSHFGELVASGAKNARHLSALAQTLLNLAKTRSMGGRFEEVVPLYEKAERSAQTAVEIEPDNASFRHIEMGAVSELAQALWNLGRTSDALQRFDRAIALGRQLVADHPEFASMHRDLGYVLSLAAGVRRLGGEHLKARALWRETIACHERALALDPSDALAASYLVGAHATLVVNEVQEGHLEEANTAFAQAQEADRRIWEQGVGKRWRPGTTLMGALDKAALQHLARGEHEKAERLAAMALDQAERRLPHFGERWEMQSNVGGILERLASAICAQPGRAAEAKPLFERAVMHQQKALAAQPDSPYVQGCLAWHHWGIARSMLMSGEEAPALPPMEACVKLGEEVLRRQPGNSNVKELLADCYYSLGHVRASAGKESEAVAAYERLLEFRPDHRIGLLRLSTLFANPTPPRKPDLARALALAERSVAVDPKAWGGYQPKGVALMRLGRLDEARQALETCLALQTEPNPATLLWLCMVEFRAGEEAKARALYDEAVALLEKLPGHRMERIRAEAAALLGIEAAPAEETTDR